VGRARQDARGAASEDARCSVILVVYGTTGELIKLAPVLLRLRGCDLRYATATTGQHAEQIPGLLESFGLPQPDLWLARGAAGRDLRRNADIPGWMAGVWAGFWRHAPPIRQLLRTGGGRPLVLVHGDTFTTVVGAMIGRILGINVAHVEAGLRSFDLRHPFPEELDRRVTSVLAGLHYAPGPWAVSNLRRGTVVDTGSNTIRDSLALSDELEMKPAVELPGGRFGVVSLHRYELLTERRLFASTLELLAEHAQRTPLLFVDHPVTVAAIETCGLASLLESSGLRRIPRLPFLQFVPIMRRSAFLFTDSGGNQEEAFYLDVPCLVHRKRTERREGLGENVVLSGYDMGRAREFLTEPRRFRRRQPLPDASPSDVIVADLVRRGYAA
jgi:UDP-N-acetylglucosamine 2-epimerase (non-hydrolysing)